MFTQLERYFFETYYEPIFSFHSTDFNPELDVDVFDRAANQKSNSLNLSKADRLGPLLDHGLFPESDRSRIRNYIPPKRFFVIFHSKMFVSFDRSLALQKMTIMRRCQIFKLPRCQIYKLLVVTVI